MPTAEVLLEGKKKKNTVIQPWVSLKPIRVCEHCGTYPLSGTTHNPWHLPRKSMGQYPHCPRDQGKEARCLVQTHDGRLAPVMVPTAWAGHNREKGGGAWHRAPATGKVGTGGT